MPSAGAEVGYLNTVIRHGTTATAGTTIRRSAAAISSSFPWRADPRSTAVAAIRYAAPVAVSFERGACSGRLERDHPDRAPSGRDPSPYWKDVSPLDEAEFESLLDQVRDLHRRTDEITRSKTRLHENIRSQLRWERDPPTIPSEQRDLAERVVEILTKPRLSSGQARRLYETYFGRR